MYIDNSIEYDSKTDGEDLCILYCYVIIDLNPTVKKVPCMKKSWHVNFMHNLFHEDDNLAPAMIPSPQKFDVMLISVLIKHLLY